MDKKKSDTATLTAHAHQCTPEYVRMIMRGTRANNSAKARAIIDTYNSIETAKENLSSPTNEGGKPT